MIALIPLMQFRVYYEIASGRPYSSFEQFVIRGVREGLTTVSSLQESFGVHSRLLVEALVTLTQAGWLAINEDGFALTGEGDRALAGGEIPETRIISSGKTYVLMERLSGALAPNYISFVTDQDLREQGLWEKALRLKAVVHENQLDQGQVQGYIRRRKDQWVSSIGPIYLVRKEGCWLPINVHKEGRIDNLPQPWYDQLSERILAEIGDGGLEFDGSEDHRIKTQRRGRGEDGVGWPPKYETYLEPKHVLLTNGQHREYLVRALETASSCVFIVTSFLREQAIEDLAEHFDRALVSGKDIDILWGYSGDQPGTGTAALELLRKVAYRNRVSPGRLRFNSVAANSHAKLLLWDHNEGFECCIGSYNWLSSGFHRDEDKEGRNISICLSDRAIVASLARTIGGLWARVSREKLASVQGRLDRIASALEKDSRTRLPLQSPNARIDIVRDREHEGVLQDAIRAASYRLAIASHQLSHVAAVRLAPLRGKAEPLDISVDFGTTLLSIAEQDEILGAVHAVGGRIRRGSGLHRKCYVSDNTSYIGSYNFLSADPYENAENSREVGVRIVCDTIADLIWSLNEEDRER